MKNDDADVEAEVNRLAAGDAFDPFQEQVKERQRIKREQENAKSQAEYEALQQQMDEVDAKVARMQAE